MPQSQIDIRAIAQITRQAGAIIKGYYERADFTVEQKKDDSPVTIADKDANDYILAQLAVMYPNIPVLSEEAEPADIAERRTWSRYFAVDPLDGTKEFIRHTGNFTVNIALIENGYPVAGAIYLPIGDELYYSTGTEAYLQQGNQPEQPIRIAAKTTANDLLALKSANHFKESEQRVMDNMQAKRGLQRGSSIKFCMMASGTGDMFFREGKTMIWDTAAGQAILEAAGGRVLDWDGNRYRYFADVLENRPMICLATHPNLALSWK